VHGPIEKLLREYSFLNNSLLPDSVRHSVLFPDPPASLADADLARLRAKTARVLSLPSMPDLYATLSHEDAAAARKKYKVQEGGASGLINYCVAVYRTPWAVPCLYNPLGGALFSFFLFVPHSTQHTPH